MQVLQALYKYLTGVLGLIEGQTGNGIGQIQFFQFCRLGEGI